MITSDDISGVSEGTARRIIAEARSIAPCLDSLVDDPRADAIAILTGVAAELAGRGSRLVKSQRVGPAQVEYFDVGSGFSSGDRAALRALCADTTPAGGPIGSFPDATGPVSDLWPECYSS